MALGATRCTTSSIRRPGTAAIDIWTLTALDGRHTIFRNRTVSDMTDSDRFEKLPDSELFTMAEGRTGDITAVGPAKAEIQRRRVEREIEAETTRRAHASEIAEKHIAAAQRIADKHVRTARLAATAAVCSALAAVALAVVAAVRYFQHS